jgi:activator of HSP90 ATPase
MRDGNIVSAVVRLEKDGEIKLVWPLGYLAPGSPFEERTINLRAGESRELVVR